ncbi:hypothetical protein QQA44_05825 [Sneathia vaginalis]|uniref:hypothetical protein n=1 Tax=Sneathia TaxID=168808 RepID=UPI001D02742B|nr:MULTISPECIES: hypothetical protein [Sneathia]MDK9582333.1 hypothetical protein [Sneathia vaginalis]
MILVRPHQWIGIYNEALKRIINYSSFEASDSLNENIFSLSQIYVDEYINLAIDLVLKIL